MPKKNKQDKPFIFDFKAKIFITFLLLIAFYLRVEPALFNITHFSFDQGLDIALVKKLVVDFDISLISRYTGLQGVMMGPWYTWFMAPAFILSAGSPHADVIYASVLSVATAVIAYIWSQRFVEQKTGLILAFLIAFAPPFIFASKIILSPAPLAILGVYYFLLILEIIERKNYQCIPLLAFLGSLSFQFEIGYAIFIVPATVLTILLFEKTKVLKPLTIILSTIAFIIPFLPQILFDYRNDYLISRSIMAYLSGENQSLGSESTSLFGRFFLRSEMFLKDASLSIGFIPEQLPLVVLAFSIFLYGWYLIWKTKDSKTLKYGAITASLLLFTYLGFVLYPGPIWDWYRAGVPMLFVFLFALSLNQLLKQNQTKLLVLFTLVPLFFASLQPFNRIDIWQNKYEGDASTIRNQHEALDSIYADAAGEPFSLYVYTPPVYPFIWDYQLFWYANRKYGYLPQPYDVMPQPDNPERAYLLLEPDDVTHRVEGWMGNFKTFGSEVTAWETRGGIRVKKWQFHENPQNTSQLIRYTYALDGKI